MNTCKFIPRRNHVSIVVTPTSLTSEEVRRKNRNQPSSWSTESKPWRRPRLRKPKSQLSPWNFPRSGQTRRLSGLPTWKPTSTLHQPGQGSPPSPGQRTLTKAETRLSTKAIVSSANNRQPNQTRERVGDQVSRHPPMSSRSNTTSTPGVTRWKTTTNLLSALIPQRSPNQRLQHHPRPNDERRFHPKPAIPFLVSPDASHPVEVAFRHAHFRYLRIDQLYLLSNRKRDLQTHQTTQKSRRSPDEQQSHRPDSRVNRQIWGEACSGLVLVFVLVLELDLFKTLVLRAWSSSFRGQKIFLAGPGSYIHGGHL